MRPRRREPDHDLVQPVGFARQRGRPAEREIAEHHEQRGDRERRGVERHREDLRRDQQRPLLHVAVEALMAPRDSRSA